MSDDNLQFAYGGAEFTVELFEKLQASAGTENILISPFALQACMALAFAGAKGETASEIATAMKYKSNSLSEVANNFQQVLDQYENSDVVKIANKIYVQEGQQIKADYATVTREQYYADAESVNFAESEATAHDINTWIEQKTDGLITNLITADSLNADTRLVLLNALHFKGHWQKKFERSQTEKGNFWISRNKFVKVDYMSQTEVFGYCDFDEYQCTALEMPYENSDLSLFVLMPNERDGLRKLAKAIKNVNLVELADKMRCKYTRVKFPKFKINYSLEMSNVLKKMGISKAFAEDADFSKILEPSEGYHLSKLFHKTCIEVNEDGTDATAATAGTLLAAIVVDPEFVADHPFIYWIWNKRNILFAGTFVNVPEYTAPVSQTKSKCKIM